MGIRSWFPNMLMTLVSGEQCTIRWSWFLATYKLVVGSFHATRGPIIVPTAPSLGYPCTEHTGEHAYSYGMAFEPAAVWRDWSWRGCGGTHLRGLCSLLVLVLCGIRANLPTRPILTLVRVAPPTLFTFHVYAWISSHTACGGVKRAISCQISLHS